MKFFTTLLSLLMLGTFASAKKQAVMDWHGKCKDKHPAVADVIKKYCEGAGLGLHVPTALSVKGAMSHLNPNFVASCYITGSCSPPQLVLRKYCYLQFYQMCVNNDFPDGMGSKNFGCQTWYISRSYYTEHDTNGVEIIAGGPKKGRPLKSLGKGHVGDGKDPGWD